ncbi:MobF family relaxase [Rathayibacter tritici]|uniref:MobF family relaxase n=1 Tax=Rathayibacter tritici TaxID=33888 RepID=UPI000CE7454E|nr:MobF family relaxase [Rathayibacter tritici]
MTLHKLSAGDGYAYYTSEVATADVRREKGRELGDYYTADGNPAGVWLGGGLATLGETVTTRDVEGRAAFAVHESRRVSGEVTEAQMKALFGEGLHPNADALTAASIDVGASAESALQAVKLGRRFPRYEAKDTELGARIRDAYAAFERVEHRAPDLEERRRIRVREGAQVFREQKGREPFDKEELGRFITAAQRPQQAAVAGYDLVFSPAKSVSTLWALGDDATRHAIEAAHETAIAESVVYLEQHAVATRTGSQGAAQDDVRGGLIATRFRHYDSRNGDPQLHDHVVVSNKVRGVDGSWRTLDGALLHKMNVPTSEFYNQRVAHHIREALGVAFEPHTVRAGKRPVMEIAGIDPDLMKDFSSRSTDIRRAVKALERDYRAAHGRGPDAAARIAIAQQATLETRPVKEHARSLRELRTLWRSRAVGVAGEVTVNNLLAHARQVAADARDGSTPLLPVDVNAAAASVVGVVSEHHAVWGANVIEAEARRWAQEQARADVTEETVQAVVTAALREHSVSITPPPAHAAFAPLTRADGSSIYEHRGRELFTSRAVIDAEDQLLTAARSTGVPPVAVEHFAAAVLAHEGPLDDGQRDLAREFACSDRQLVVGVGPAGAGKTTSLNLAARAIESAGGRMIGVAPSAAAAAVLKADVGIDTHTLHGFLLQLERGEESAQLRPGDVVVVDEAGMAGTVRLAMITEQATRAGATVRLIGDDRQLSAVEAGGALRLIENEAGAIRLETVHRFRNADGTANEDEAAASLLLRDAEQAAGGDAFTWYRQQDRVTAVTAESATDAVFAAWQADTSAGKTSLMMASTNATVADLNARAQAFRISTGDVRGRRTAALRDGLAAHVGDVVVTRSNTSTLRYNARRDRVLNNDVWDVKRVHPDGALTVRNRRNGGQTRLPAEYVKAHTELGYAATVHRAQGMTVDTAHALADRRTGREAAYVALTRGRSHNHLYLALEPGESVDEGLAAIAGNVDRALTATETIRAEQTRTADLGTLAAQFRDVHDRADDIRIATAIDVTLGGRTLDELRQSGTWADVKSALVDAERAGFTLEKAVATAWQDGNGLDGADDRGALIAWRIRDTSRWGRVHADVDTITGRPLAGMSDEALQRALEHATRTRCLAETQLEIGANADTHWRERRFGHLSDLTLAGRVAQQRVTVAQPVTDRQQARQDLWLLGELNAENRARKALPVSVRVQENRERGAATVRPDRGVDPASATPGAIAAVWNARTLENQLAAETRLRARLPDTPSRPVADRPRIPEWIADARLLTDSRVREDWREHLTERYEHLASQYTLRGEQLAAAPPAWAVEHLGPVPAGDSAMRPEWIALAAEIDHYRAVSHTLDTDSTLLGGAGQDTVLAQALTGRADELRLANPTPGPVPVTAPVGAAGPRTVTAEEFAAAVAAEAFAAGMSVAEYEQLVESFRQTGEPLPAQNVYSRLCVDELEPLAAQEPAGVLTDTLPEPEGARLVSAEEFAAAVAAEAADAGMTVAEYEQLVESFRQTGQPLPAENVYARLRLAADDDSAPTADATQTRPQATRHPAFRADPASAAPTPQEEARRRGLGH